MSRRADLTLARGVRQALALIDRADDVAGPDPVRLRDLLSSALELYERDAPAVAGEVAR